METLTFAVLDVIIGRLVRSIKNMYALQLTVDKVFKFGKNGRFCVIGFSFKYFVRLKYSYCKA